MINWFLLPDLSSRDSSTVESMNEELAQIWWSQLFCQDQNDNDFVLIWWSPSILKMNNF